MDKKKVTKTPAGASKKKSAGGVSRAAYGVVASATGSGGAPTTSNRRQPKLKTQEKVGAKDVDAAEATLAELASKVDFKALYEEGKEKKSIKEMEYEEGQQPTGEIALPIHPGKAATVASVVDVEDEEEGDLLPPSKAIFLDNSPAIVWGKRKRQALTPSQRKADEIKAKAFKRVRKVVVKPPLPPSAESSVPYSTGLLEDPFLKKLASGEKDVLKNIAASIASKEEVEKQLSETSKKLEELSSESEAFKQKEVELLAELGKLRKAAEASATVISDLKQERNRTQATEEKIERQAAKANQEEIERLKSDLKAISVARTKEMLTLQKENESRQARIRELEKMLQKNEHLEKELADLYSSKEKEHRLWSERETERKMRELQAQLEQQQKEKETEFKRRAEINKEELREHFQQEMEKLKQAAASQIAEEVQKKSEIMKASTENANRLAREAENRRAMAERNERLNRENMDLIEKLERLEKGTSAVEPYSVMPVNPSSCNVVSEISDAMGVIEKRIIAKNQIFIEDITQSINNLENNIKLSGQKLVAQQDLSLEQGMKRFGDLIKNSMNTGVEIQDAMNKMYTQIDKMTTESRAYVSTATDVIKRLEDRFVEGMDHDGPSADTDKIVSAWNLIKQSLINMISTAFTEIKNLITALEKNSAIRDKDYVESTKKAAERAFSLLVNNKDLMNVLAQLGIQVILPDPYGPNPTDPVEVKSVRTNSEDNDDIETVKMKMSMGYATYREIETIISDVRVIAVQFANTERQSLQGIETSKIVANLENSTASRLYYELDRFHLFTSTIENAQQFQEEMRLNSAFIKVFQDAIPFMGSRKGNRKIMEFLQRKGYSIREEMASSIDDFFSKILDIKLTEDSEWEHRNMNEDDFIATVIGILTAVTEAIQEIKKRASQNELRQYLEGQLRDQREWIEFQTQPNQMSLAAEIDSIRESGGALALPSPSSLTQIPAFAEELRNEMRQITNIVKDSEEKYSQNIGILINRHEERIKNIETQQLEERHRFQEHLRELETQQLEERHRFQEHLREQKEEQWHKQENMERAFREELAIRKHQNMVMLQEQQQDQTTLPSSSPSRVPGEEASGLQDHDDMEFTETGFLREDDSERREMKEQLTKVLTMKGEEELSVDGDRNIKMFLKPEETSDKTYVEVVLSSKDNERRNINTEGLKECLPDMKEQASSSSKEKNRTALKSNTLTGEIFLDTLKDKVFPYSSKSALEDEEGGPATLHHPEYYRSSFSRRFFRDSTFFTEPHTFTEKSESVRNFTRLLEYSLFNDTARGARSDNDILSSLIYVVFEHDAKMIRYLSDIAYKFREYASRKGETDCISLHGDRGNLLEATIATIFSAALPVVSSMTPARIAEALSEPVEDDVRIRSTYSLLSLIEKFIICASKRVHVLKHVLEKSGLVNRLSLYPAAANADKNTSFDVQYDYSLLRMLLELMTINISNLVDTGIRPLKAVVLAIGTFTGADKTRDTDRAFIPIDKDRSVLSKMYDSDIDVPKTISVVNYLSAVTNWYIANRFSGKDDDAVKKILSKAVDIMHTLLADNLGGDNELVNEFCTKLKDAASSSIVDYVSKTVLPKLNAKIKEIVEKTMSNDAILIKGASGVGSLGETAVNVSLGASREHLALPWLEVDFRGGIDDSTLLWVLSGGVNSDEVVRGYQLAVPSIRSRSAAPLYVYKSLVRIINNTSGSDNVFLTTNNYKKTPGKEEEGGGGERVHVVNLSENVSCVLEYSTKDRYEAVINKMYRDGLVLVKGDAEVPRVFPTLDGKWMDNSRDNRTFAALSVSRWKMPSASLVYGMLSKKKTKEEEQNQEVEEKKNKTNASAPSVIDFMGGRAGDVFLKMLTLPSEQPIVTDSSSFDASSTTNKGLWKTNKDGYTFIDAQSMVARLIKDDKRPINNARTAATAAAAGPSTAVVPYNDAANVVVNDPLEMYNSNNSWWIRGIGADMRKDAAALSAVQEHLYFVQTPIF